MRLSLLGLCLAMVCAVSCVVVKHDDEAKAGGGGGLEFYFAGGSFNAASYVAEIWDSKLIPYAREGAVELPVLLKLLAEDEAGATKTYGRRQVAEGAPFNFAVAGSAIILRVNKESRVGIAELDIPGYGAAGKADVLLQIGPVFKGSSIRDSLPFVVFDDFVNQLDYASLSNELNVMVRDKVAAAVDFEGSEGRQLEFRGFITYEPGILPVVTPVELRFSGTEEK